ncbi:choline kinase family protein [Marinomonas rhizomae]|uniref:Thiamine kinase-like enzyme n=1 Tax=Marinomonas rhizomae TaxID=491948 RepID=A0A366J600_9GAMM|nr:choline kinase family protein [Marinomonas rhizomae]RBP82456.1 thiamine kinase-like enzyme [Marinomonas rhizomae]
MTNLTAHFDKMARILPEFNKIQVIPFEEGFSNKVYRLDWNSVPQIVLRVPALDEVAFGIDRKSEMSVLLAAAESGISPSVLWHDGQGVFACQYVAQPSLNWDVSHSLTSIARIARILAQAHTLPEVKHPFCIYELIEHYLLSIESFLPNRCDLQEEVGYLRGLFSNLPRVDPSDSPVVCHNDLNPKNVLIDDHEIWVIDWEYTGMGDPLFDLAVVARSHNLTCEQQVYFIQNYDDSLDVETTLQKMAKYSLAYSLREMAWLLLKHLTTPNDPDSWPYYVDFKAMPSLNPFL